MYRTSLPGSPWVKTVSPRLYSPMLFATPAESRSAEKLNGRARFLLATGIRLMCVTEPDTGPGDRSVHKRTDALVPGFYDGTRSPHIRRIPPWSFTPLGTMTGRWHERSRP